jgi:hypothetical protein
MIKDIIPETLILGKGRPHVLSSMISRKILS